MDDIIEDETIFDEDATLANFSAGDVVIDRRWPDDAAFEIGFVEEVQEDHLVIFIPHEESYLAVNEVHMPYLESVGDHYYDKHMDALEKECCKEKNE